MKSQQDIQGPRRDAVESMNRVSMITGGFALESRRFSDAIIGEAFKGLREQSYIEFQYPNESPKIEINIKESLRKKRKL